ncbi:ATP-binding cassette domain-containing protein, partial [Campylobacter coli]
KETSGTILFGGRPVSSMNGTERQKLRQEIQYIFQDPFASLDPRKTVGFSIAEPIRTHALIDGSKPIQKRVDELLERVGLTSAHAS